MFLLSLVENGALWCHMPKAVKYSSQNQSGLFFPLDHDQVAGREEFRNTENALLFIFFFKNEEKKKN